MEVDIVTTFSYFALTLLLFFRPVMMDAMSSGNHEIGKKLRAYPFKLLTDIGLQMCVRECESFTPCLSVNFNRKMLSCGLHGKKANGNSDLVDAEGYIYRDLPGIVSNIYIYFTKYLK
jgi:hypothetical protein